MIGFDIGGTKCAVCIGHRDGDSLIIENKKVIPTNLNISPYEMIDKMCALAESMTDDFSLIGISCGGPLDSKKGIIMSPPNLKGWDNVEIVSYLEKRYGGKVNLQNDANACAVAEWKFGAGKGCSNMIFLTFGTGLGAGLILDSKLYSGTNDMAGEAGHIRLANEGPMGYGKEGSFEGFCSGGGIAKLGRMYAEKCFAQKKSVSFCRDESELSDISAKLIAEKANEGFEDAIEIYNICARKLGEGLAVLVDILNPEKIVIGSIYKRAGNLLAPAMNEVLKREALGQALDVCTVDGAHLDENIGDYAALSVAEL